MRRLRTLLKNKTHVTLSVPALLGFVAFITNLIAALKDGVIDDTELHNLLTLVDGFETVCIVIVMLALGEKKK